MLDILAHVRRVEAQAAADEVSPRATTGTPDHLKRASLVHRQPRVLVDPEELAELRSDLTLRQLARLRLDCSEQSDQLLDGSWGAARTLRELAGGLGRERQPALGRHLASDDRQFAEKKFAPAPTSPARARYYEAIVYAVSTIDECVIPMYFHKKLLPEGKRDPKVVASKEPTWKTAASVLTARLGDKPYLCGDEITAADIVVGYDLMLAMQIGLLAEHPKLAAYAERLISRPAWKRTFGG